MMMAMTLATLAGAEVKNEPPVKIYLLVGQSNMQGKGAVEGDGSNSLRYAVNHDPKKEFQFLFFPMTPGKDLKEPVENVGGKYRYLREPKPFNIDQTKLNCLVLQDGTSCSYDEIRVGPTYESVVGGGTK